MFDLSLANTCDNCDKHLAAIHGLGKEPVCDRCLRITTLLTCGGCHEVRYCSKDCQQTHWRSSHKEKCAEHLRVVELGETFGPIVVAQRKSILRWSKKHRIICNAAAVFALGVGTNEDKSQSHCFLVTVKAGSAGGFSSVTALNAEIVSDEELQARGVPPDPDILRKQFNCTKMIFFDPALPQFLGLIHMLVETVDVHAARETVGNATVHWKAWLMDSLTAVSGGGDLMPITDYNDYGSTAQSRRAALESWCGQFGEKFGMAAYSALNLGQNTKAMSTHVLRVHVDGIGAASPLYKVRAAEVVSFDEVKMPKPLKGLLYTLVVDDSLPESIAQLPIGLDVHNFTVKGLYIYRHDWLQHLKQAVDQF